MEEIYVCKNCEHDKFYISTSGAFICAKCATRHTPVMSLNIDIAFAKSTPAQMATGGTE